MHFYLFPLAVKHRGVHDLAVEAQADARWCDYSGFKTGIFAIEEINNIFTLFDLKKDGFISQAQCKEALKTLASSELQTEKITGAEVPDTVDQKSFLRLCQTILGLA